MFKKCLVMLTILPTIAFARYEVFHTPHQGQEAFDKVFQQIAKAKTSVKVTVYSWSQSELDQALKTAARNGASVRVVLHPPLAESKASAIAKLEAEGVEFKKSFQQMHEKFVIVDDQFLMNTSANYSNGARDRYSENFVLFYRPPTNLLQQFRREFALLWDSGTDIFTHNEEAAEEEGALDIAPVRDAGQSAVLYSSSQNFDYAPTSANSQARAEGQYLRPSKKDSWVVQEQIIKAIRGAKDNIHCGLNHFFLPDVEQAMISAVRRKVDVKLAVDNQEFVISNDPREQTAHFVNDWAALPGNAEREAPVRIKYYSHAPSPSFWLLNHHKFCLVDYDAEGAGAAPMVISGSYNLSETAEKNQFDNMVFYRGEEYLDLMESFHLEFQNLWQLNRDDEDEIDVTQLVSVEANSLTIHADDAYSLTWSEAREVRNLVKFQAPAFFTTLSRQFQSRDCQHYDLRSEKFAGCR